MPDKTTDFLKYHQQLEAARIAPAEWLEYARSFEALIAAADAGGLTPEALESALAEWSDSLRAAVAEARSAGEQAESAIGQYLGDLLRSYNAFAPAGAQNFTVAKPITAEAFSQFVRIIDPANELYNTTPSTLKFVERIIGPFIDAEFKSKPGPLVRWLTKNSDNPAVAGVSAQFLSLVDDYVTHVREMVETRRSEIGAPRVKGPPSASAVLQDDAYLDFKEKAAKRRQEKEFRKVDPFAGQATTKPRGKTGDVSRPVSSRGRVLAFGVRKTPVTRNLDQSIDISAAQRKASRKFRGAEQYFGLVYAHAFPYAKVLDELLAEKSAAKRKKYVATPEQRLERAEQNVVKAEKLMVRLRRTLAKLEQQRAVTTTLGGTQRLLQQLRATQEQIAKQEDRLARLRRALAEAQSVVEQEEQDSETRENYYGWRRNAADDDDDEDDEEAAQAERLFVEYFAAVKRRYVFQYPMSLTEAAKAAGTARRFATQTFNKYEDYASEARPDINLPPSFIIDFARLFVSEGQTRLHSDAVLANPNNTPDLVDWSFLGYGPKGYTYLHQLRQVVARQAETPEKYEYTPRAQVSDAVKNYARRVANHAAGLPLDTYVTKDSAPEVRAKWTDFLAAVDVIRSQRKVVLGGEAGTRLVKLLQKSFAASDIDAAFQKRVRKELLDLIKQNKAAFDSSLRSNRARYRRNPDDEVPVEPVESAAIADDDDAEQETESGGRKRVPEVEQRLLWPTLDSPAPTMSWSAAVAASAQVHGEDTEAAESVEPAEPPPSNIASDQPVHLPVDWTINDWLDKDNTFFGITVDMDVQYGDDDDENDALVPFDTFGPMNVVQAAQFYRGNQLHVESVTPKYVQSPAFSDDDDDDYDDDDDDGYDRDNRRRNPRSRTRLRANAAKLRTFIFRFSFDALQDVQAGGADGFIDELIEAADENNAGPFAFQLVWPVATEPLSLDEAVDVDALGPVISEFVSRQMRYIEEEDPASAPKDAVLLRMQDALLREIEDFRELVTAEVPTGKRNKEGEDITTTRTALANDALVKMYKRAGRIQAITARPLMPQLEGWATGIVDRFKNKDLITKTIGYKTKEDPDIEVPLPPLPWFLMFFMETAGHKPTQYVLPEMPAIVNGVAGKINPDSGVDPYSGDPKSGSNVYDYESLTDYVKSVVEQTCFNIGGVVGDYANDRAYRAWVNTLEVMLDRVVAGFSRTIRVPGVLKPTTWLEFHKERCADNWGVDIAYFTQRFGQLVDTFGFVHQIQKPVVTGKLYSLGSDPFVKLSSKLNKNTARPHYINVVYDPTTGNTYNNIVYEPPGMPAPFDFGTVETFTPDMRAAAQEQYAELVSSAGQRQFIETGAGFEAKQVRGRVVKTRARSSAPPPVEEKLQTMPIDPNFKNWLAAEDLLDQLTTASEVKALKGAIYNAMNQKEAFWLRQTAGFAPRFYPDRAEVNAIIDGWNAALGDIPRRERSGFFLVQNHIRDVVDRAFYEGSHDSEGYQKLTKNIDELPAKVSGYTDAFVKSGDPATLQRNADALRELQQLSEEIEYYCQQIVTPNEYIGSTPDAEAAINALLELCEENPTNMAYAVAAQRVAYQLNPKQKKRPTSKEEAESTADESAADESTDESAAEPRENRRRSRVNAASRRGASRRQPRERAPLSSAQQAYMDKLSAGPAFIVRQAVVTAASKQGLSLRAAFRAALKTLSTRGLVDVATGALVLTAAGEAAEQKLKRLLVTDKALLKQITTQYLALVRAEKLRKKMAAALSARLNGLRDTVAPPGPPELAPRDNPSGYALSGRVKKRKMYDPETGDVEVVPVIEYRPQVYQDVPPTTLNNNQKLGLGRKGRPYRPRIYVPLDLGDYPTTEEFHKNISQPTHAKIRTTLDWGSSPQARQHTAGPDIATYAPDELVPLARKWRKAGPRGAALKNVVFVTPKQEERADEAVEATIRESERVTKRQAKDQAAAEKKAAIELCKKAVAGIKAALSFIQTQLISNEIRALNAKVKSKSLPSEGIRAQYDKIVTAAETPFSQADGFVAVVMSQVPEELITKEASAQITRVQTVKDSFKNALKPVITALATARQPVKPAVPDAPPIAPPPESPESFEPDVSESFDSDVDLSDLGYDEAVAYAERSDGSVEAFMRRVEANVGDNTELDTNTYTILQLAAFARRTGVPTEAVTPKPAGKPAAPKPTTRRPAPPPAESFPYAEEEDGLPFVISIPYTAKNMDIEVGAALEALADPPDDVHKAGKTAREQVRAWRAAAGAAANALTNRVREDVIKAMIAAIGSGGGADEITQPLTAYVSPETIQMIERAVESYGVDTVARIIGAYINGLASDKENSKLKTRNNNGGSFYGSRFQGFRVR